MAVVFLSSSLLATATHTWSLQKSGAECSSGNIPLGPKTSLQECADACFAAPTCNFFVSGTGSEQGHCHQEVTNSSRCPEGFLVNDAYDFYALTRVGTRGCTDARASNYDPAATDDDGSCKGADTCVARTASGACANCVAEKQCTSGNEGYRNAQFDTIYATRVPDGTIVIDGSLRDWSGHTTEHCYRDVAFATESGDEVVFEAHDGGVWFG